MWTLNEARKHYQEQNPTCKKCTFSSIEKAPIVSEYFKVDSYNIKCAVREECVLNNRAKDCIYFTSNL